MTTRIEIDTGAITEESVHVKLDGDRGVRVQPIDMTIGNELQAEFDELRLDAAKRKAEAKGVELRELTDEDRDELGFRFSEGLRGKVKKALLDVLDGWDETLVTDAAGNEIAPDAMVGAEGTRVPARDLVVEHWSRKRVPWCMRIIKEATDLSGALEGNSQSGAVGIGDGARATPLEAVLIADDDPSTDPTHHD